MWHCLAAWVTGRDGEERDDGQKSTVEMESVKDPPSERECLLRACAGGRASLLHPLWQQQFESIRDL